MDENNDCTHTHDMDGMAYFLELDGGILSWLTEKVTEHCLPDVDEKKD